MVGERPAAGASEHAIQQLPSTTTRLQSPLLPLAHAPTHGRRTELCCAWVPQLLHVVFASLLPLAWPMPVAQSPLAHSPSALPCGAVRPCYPCRKLTYLSPPPPSATHTCPLPLSTAASASQPMSPFPPHHNNCNDPDHACRFPRGPRALPDNAAPPPPPPLLL